MKTKLFISERVPGVPTVFLISIREGTHDTGRTLFTNVLPRTFALTSYEFVPAQQQASIISSANGRKSE